MKLNKYFIAAVLALLLCRTSIHVHAQTKIILDKNNTGGYCNNYYDLGENGFILVYNKNKDIDEGTGTDATLSNTFYYYSKDLSKHSVFKINTNGQVSFYANSKNLFIIDRLSTRYTVKVLDYNGREINQKKFNLEDIGLNQDLISRMFFTLNGMLWFEVYDGMDNLHLFKTSLMLGNEEGVKEMDIALPSSNPLESMKFQGNWKLITENSGYMILARKGANAEYDPSAIAYHLAFYDEDLNLFRELLLDNFLSPGTQMLGKDASFSLNPALQSFVVSCLIQKNGKPAFLVGNYGMDASSQVMKKFWSHEIDIIDNVKNKLVEFDGLSVPLPPFIGHKGGRVWVSVFKARTNVQEESLNQLVMIDAAGKITLNAIQMGNYEQLNLDNYCVDNANLYSRIKNLQMNSVLKPYCELQNVDVLDIDLDAQNNELAIVRNYDRSKNQVTIYYFPVRK